MDEFEELLSSIPAMQAVVPIARVVPGPRGSRIAFSCAEIFTNGIRILALQTGASLMDEMPMPLPGAEDGWSDEQEARRLASLWRLTDDLGTVYGDRHSGGSGNNVQMNISIHFNVAPPAEATTLRLTQGSGGGVEIEFDLKRIPVVG